MDYRRFENTIICRIDKGEEVVSTLRALAEKENVHLAEVRGLGALNDFTLGLYQQDTHEYDQKRFTFPCEMTNLWGMINTKEGELYSHIHITVADLEGKAFGGHLVEAWIGVTCELWITVRDEKVGRKMDPELKINLLDFDAE